jgi:multisubunit Na+/H+ antiporter MnhG subunit
MTTGKIALAHLNEFPDYYTRLHAMEEEAERFHGKHD